MPGAPRLFLIDGSGYIYRAYYAVRPLSTRDGTPTNAVVGFARMLGKLLRQERPTLLGIAFDERGKTFRHEMYEAYKANREAPPEDLVPQFPLIHELVDAMEIPRLSITGYEADDVLATLAQRAADAGHPVTIVSGDKDLMQLVSKRITMFDPLKDRRYDPLAVEEKFGVPPQYVADVQGLAGDSSDNIPGVPRVGPKSAAKLVVAHGDLENVISALEGQEKLKAFERSVLEHVDDARLSKKLATLATDAPVELDLDALRYDHPDATRLGSFLRKIEAYAMLRDFGVNDASQPVAAPESEPPPSEAPATPPAVASAPIEPIDRSVYHTIVDAEELRTLLAAAETEGRLSVDLETTSLDPMKAEIVGIALCVPGHPAAYVPISHRYLGAPKQIPLDAALDALRPVLEAPGVAKVGQNLKYDLKILARHGIALTPIGDDSLIAAYVLDPGRASFSLDTLAREALGHETIRYRDVAGTGKKQIGFDEVDVPRATEYAAEDADVALRLCELMPRQIEDAGLTSLYRELELPLMPILAEMERTGVRIDRGHLQKLASEFTERLREIEERAHELAGETVNLASPKQLGVLFFEKLGYPVIKRTKTSYSTDAEVLETLARDYDLPRVILEHRTLAKLKSTYVDALLKLAAAESDRVHTTFNQSGAATGRLSSTDPNLQNIPVRTEDGRRIRTAFITDDGWELISADYSQIELRVMAHLSADEAFVEAFQRGEDIHSRTAREILTDGVEPDAEARRRAKAINFGILYGLSEFGLSRQLDIPRKQANAYISRYFSRYPGIRAFLDRTIDEARQRGFVTTLSGRRRFLPNLRSKNGNVRQAAERIAMNTPIQGTAADLIKMAMLRVDRALAEGPGGGRSGGKSGRRFRSRLLLQVHDELVLEAPAEEKDEVVEIVRREMSGVMSLAVPLVVDIGCGKTWASAH